MLKSDDPSAEGTTHLFLDSSNVCFVFRGRIDQEKRVKNGSKAPGMYNAKVMRVEQKGSAICIAEREGRSVEIEGIGARIFLAQREANASAQL